MCDDAASNSKEKREASNSCQTCTTVQKHLSQRSSLNKTRCNFDCVANVGVGTAAERVGVGTAERVGVGTASS